MKLFTVSNPKTDKGVAYGYLTAILHLSPYTAAGGTNVCPMAEIAACHHACLNTAGHGGIGLTTKGDNTVQAARRARTQLMQNQWEVFFAQLVEEISLHCRQAMRHGLVPCIRLNGTSDLRWEVMRCKGVTIVELFPTVQFYDYTKIPNRRNLPSNYHLTLSYSAASAEYAALITQAAEKQDRNLAVVFGKLPESFLGRPVINGDLSDLRFLDPTGVVVGLVAKGRAKKDISGFVVRSEV